MKTIFAALIALGTLAGAAQAAPQTDIIDGHNSVVEWCKDSYGGY